LAVSVSFWSPVRHIAGLTPALRTLLATLVLSLPFFFSGLVFSSAFRDALSPEVAYGSNLLGAMFGGVLENASIIHGLRSLSAFALATYGLAWLSLVAVRRNHAKSPLRPLQASRRHLDGKFPAQRRPPPPT